MKRIISEQSFLIVITLFFVAFIGFSCATSSDSAKNMSGDSSGQGGSMARFTISGDFLYTVDHKTLKVFDVSKPEQINYLESRDQAVGIDIETIFTMDTLLFIGSQNGMYIYDIKRPGLPLRLSSVQHIRSCDPVVAQGNYAYVTLNTENSWCGGNLNVLQIYDISNPKEPILMKTMPLDYPKGLGIDGNKLFICSNGVRVYDITSPTNPIWIDDLSYMPEAGGITMYDVIPRNGILLAVGETGLWQFDYSGEKMSFVSKIAVNKD